MPTAQPVVALRAKPDKETSEGQGRPFSYNTSSSSRDSGWLSDDVSEGEETQFLEVVDRFCQGLVVSEDTAESDSLNECDVSESSLTQRDETMSEQQRPSESERKTPRNARNIIGSRTVLEQIPLRFRQLLQEAADQAVMQRLRLEGCPIFRQAVDKFCPPPMDGGGGPWGVAQQAQLGEMIPWSQCSQAGGLCGGTVTSSLLPTGQSLQTVCIGPVCPSSYCQRDGECFMSCGSQIAAPQCSVGQCSMGQCSVGQCTAQYESCSGVPTYVFHVSDLSNQCAIYNDTRFFDSTLDSPCHMLPDTQGLARNGVLITGALNCSTEHQLAPIMEYQQAYPPCDKGFSPSQSVVIPQVVQPGSEMLAPSEQGMLAPGGALAQVSLSPAPRPALPLQSARSSDTCRIRDRPHEMIVVADSIV